MIVGCGLKKADLVEKLWLTDYCNLQLRYIQRIEKNCQLVEIEYLLQFVVAVSLIDQYALLPLLFTNVSSFAHVTADYFYIVTFSMRFDQKVIFFITGIIFNAHPESKLLFIPL